ncbi:MAG TPA: DNA repair protein RadC [bacterium]|nr:DNA repair protein RadC [bacterium]
MIRKSARVRDFTLVCDDSPHSRLAVAGPTALAVRELLEMILGRGKLRRQGRSPADELAAAFPSLSVLDSATFDDFAAIVGQHNAGRLAAALELGRRVRISSLGDRPVIQTAVDVYQLLGSEMRQLDREHFRTILLNTKNRVIRVCTISIGGLSQAPVHPREVFKDAIKHGACSLIVVHNHPSGDATPSGEDSVITDQLAAAGKLIGIPVLDHIIIGDGLYVSLREKGLLSSPS